MLSAIRRFVILVRQGTDSPWRTWGIAQELSGARAEARHSYQSRAVPQVMRIENISLKALLCLANGLSMEQIAMRFQP